MKAITIENLIAHIRPLRTGKTFLCNFINDCKIIDVVPMENIDKMIAEISTLTAHKSDTEYQDGFYDCETMVLDLIDEYCKGDT